MAQQSTPPRPRGRLAVLLALLLAAGACAAPPEGPVRTADEALARLTEGNTRFKTDRPRHPHLDAQWRHRTATEGQHPFAAVLACSDSRVPVEAIFDQGLGDLFVLRDAGNVSGVEEVGTLEYAVEHLKTPLLVVLGHRGCGAVTAAVHHDPAHGDLAKLLKHIEPAVASAEGRVPKLSGEALVQAAVEDNVRHSIREILAESEDLRKAAASGALRVVGAVYDLDSGEVRWLDR